MTPLKWSRLSVILVCKMIIATERNVAEKRGKYSRENAKHIEAETLLMLHFLFIALNK